MFLRDTLRTLGESLALLRTRRFGTYWFATFLSNIGTWAQLVAEPWLLLSLGATPFVVGLDAFALDAPVLLLTLVGGLLADHGDRRRVIALFQSIQMLCPTLLVVLLLSGLVQPWIVVLLSFVVGITDALSMPSFQSIVPSIVPRDQIGAGLALSSTQFNLSRIVGPAVAGVLMGGVGAVGCFAVSAASYLPFILVALWILPRGRANRGAFDRRRPFAGVARNMRDPYLRGAFLTVLVSSLWCAPLVTFSVVLVRNVFHGDAASFSVTMAAFGLGGLVGAVGLLGIDRGRDRRRLSSTAAACYGVVVLLASVNPWLWALPALTFLAGVAMTASNTSANTLVQSAATARTRGQAVSLFMLAMRGGASLGNLLAGVSIEFLGVRRALLVNGAIAVVAHVAVGRAWSRARTPAAEA